MSKVLQGTAMEHCYHKWEAPLSYSMLQNRHKNRSYLVELRTALLLFLFFQRIRVFLMLGTCVCMLARTGVSRVRAVGFARRWHADISSLRVVFWMGTALATTYHLDRDYHRVSTCKLFIQSGSGVFLEFSDSRCTCDTTRLIVPGIKLILYFQKRKKHFGKQMDLCTSIEVPFNLTTFKGFYNLKS